MGFFDKPVLKRFACWSPEMGEIESSGNDIVAVDAEEAAEKYREQENDGGDFSDENHEIHVRDGDVGGLRPRQDWAEVVP